MLENMFTSPEQATAVIMACERALERIKAPLPEIDDKKSVRRAWKRHLDAQKDDMTATIEAAREYLGVLS